MVYNGLMFEGKTVGAVLLLGGEGRRFGGAIPKQFCLLGGKKIYRYALDIFLDLGFFDEILLVVHPDWTDLAHPGTRVVIGGKTRQESSFRGVMALKKGMDLALIHDAVRPFVTERIVKENVAAAIKWGAANTCVPSTDTLVYAPEGGKITSIPKRAEYLRGQTPQTFRMDWILKAHEKALEDRIENASDDCQLVLRLGKSIHAVAGEETNLKITSKFDLFTAEQLLAKGRAGDFHQRI